MAEAANSEVLMNDQALAQALQSADFTAAQYAAVEFGCGVRAEVDAAADPVHRSAICQEALETLHNHLHLARVLRAHLAAQIQSNAGSCLYAQREAETDCHRWQFEA
jgi:hypothetical protein